MPTDKNKKIPVGSQTTKTDTQKPKDESSMKKPAEQPKGNISKDKKGCC